MNDELSIPGFVPKDASFPVAQHCGKIKARTSILGAEGLLGCGPRHRRGAAVRLAWLAENTLAVQCFLHASQGRCESGSAGAYPMMNYNLSTVNSQLSTLNCPLGLVPFCVFAVPTLAVLRRIANYE